MGNQSSHNILPPLLGLNKRYSYRQKPPYSTADCLNVRPMDVFKKRERIGSRPGLGKYFFEQLGSGSPINMMADIDAIVPNGLKIWSDFFIGSIDSIWSKPSWIDYEPSVLNEDSGIDAFNGEAGLIRENFSPFVTTASYEVEIEIKPFDGQHWGRYQIFTNLNDTTPNIGEEGVVCELTITGISGAYSGRVVDVTSGAGTVTNITSGNIGSAKSHILSVIRNGTNVKFSIDGVQLASVTVAAHSYKRVGFAMASSILGGVCIVNSFRMQYSEGVYTELEKNTFCCASNGILYSNKANFNKLDAVTTNLSLNKTNVLSAIDRYQKAYICDWEEPKTKQTDGVVSSTALSSAGVSDWTTLGLNIYDYVVVITSENGVTAGVYEISVIAAGSLTLSSAPGNGTAVSFYVQRCPKVYDPLTGTLTLLKAESGKGMIPVGCDNLILYRDRLLWTGDNKFYMSRQGNPLDYSYNLTDTQRALASQLSEAGDIGKKIKASISFKDDLVLFFCSDSIWILQGDPVYGGNVNSLTKKVGIASKTAYCITPSNTVVFVSVNSGVYEMAYNSTAVPTSISRELLPNELINVDENLIDISMEWDPDFPGVHIYLTPKTGGNVKHWFIDWKSKSFWPVQLTKEHQPKVSFFYKSDITGCSKLLLGCRDGYVRVYDKNYENDDGISFDSYLVYGPIALSKDDRKKGKIIELTSVIADWSGDIDWSMRFANTYEECLRKAESFCTGTWTRTGLNPKDHPEGEGAVFSLKVENGEFKPWAIENINYVSEETGLLRVLS
jgi:hypothetical protein